MVSWKEAADRKLSVASDALVMPRITCSASAGLPALGHDALVLGPERVPIDELAGQEEGVALGEDAHLLHHLPDDQLDVLVVDLDALRAVDLLHLVDEVALGPGVTCRAQQVGRVERARRQGRTGLDDVAVLDQKVRAPRERVLLRRAVVGDDRELRPPLGVLDLDTARDLGDARHALRLARLEQLDDARQAVRDVGSGHAAGVEGAHGELRAGLADRLRRDMAHGVADVGLGVGRQTVAVALLADAVLGRRT